MQEFSVTATENILLFAALSSKKTILKIADQDYQVQELIEVLKYYNEMYDEFVIVANGIWLNSQTKEKISPIPFDHHRLPFAKIVFELADEECFYGKSFPDILSGEQETRNALLRLMIPGTKPTKFSPLFDKPLCCFFSLPFG